MSNINPQLMQWLAATGFERLPGVFVTGTDTGVGKTWVSTRLIKVLRAIGRDITPRKPAESGWSDTDVTLSDTWQLSQVAGVNPEMVCQNRFRAPLSPPRAALLEGKHLQIGTLVQQCREGLSAGQFLLVEGAGGFYSPLADDGLNADLAVALGLPLLVVAEDRVGCINHILLVVEAAQRRNLTVAGIVLNQRQPAPAGMDNATDLRGYISIPILPALALG
ncbi:MAG: dethiobiotin synthase [Thiothrix sp.]|uniref:dethiobiotin synthase n=1 Tax=Thiothrix sp. TaxID=1032 RepID=UPI00261FF3D1|nr:dethiobiotin synthase [Thiothrix sp.]MDD5391868.1 dethiobiotin synthase [Thiothrix sp.]